MVSGNGNDSALQAEEKTVTIRGNGTVSVLRQPAKRKRARAGMAGLFRLQIRKGMISGRKADTVILNTGRKHARGVNAFLHMKTARIMMLRRKSIS